MQPLPDWVPAFAGMSGFWVVTYHAARVSTSRRMVSPAHEGRPSAPSTTALRAAVPLPRSATLHGGGASVT
jgi:hypothetical protein